MSKMRLRYFCTLLALLMLVVAACSPAAPTATSVPPTDEPTEAAQEAEETEEAEEAEEVATEEATEEAEEVATEEVEEEATEEAVMEATEEMATEEATEEAEEEATEVAMAEVTEEAVMEATEEMATEEATEEAEEVATEEATEVVAAEEQTIVDIALGNDDFSTLVAGLEAAELVETLQGEGPFTVFAPTNDAFEALPEGALDALLADQAALTQVLLYHVVAGEVLAEDVVELESAETIQGSEITIAVNDDGEVVLNDTVIVTATDIVASNGVIHVIDGVLLPPVEEAEEEPTEVAMAEVTEEAVMEATEEMATEEAEEVVVEEATEEAVMEATEEMATEEAVMEATEEVEEMGDMGATVMVAPGDAITLGVATILSGEGLVPLGADIQRGVELALAERPTVTVGDVEFTIELDVQDDQCSAEGGQAVANRFVSDSSVIAVVGPTCSSACRAAGPIFDEAGYINLSSSCTAPDLTAVDTGFSSFNRTTPNDLLQGEIAAQFIFNELGITQIATIHDGSPYGEGLVSVLTENFTALGGEVVYADAVNVGDTDFRNLLDNVADAAPGLIYFGGFPAEAARLSEQRADAGLDEVPFMGADGINTPEYASLAGAAAEGTYASSPVAGASEAYDAFVATYEEVYGTAPTAAFHAYAYDATIIVLDAIEAVGTIDDNGDLVVDRAALSDYIRAYGQDEPVQGLSGSLSCDGTGDCATGGIGFFQVVDGAFARFEAE